MRILVTGGAGFIGSHLVDRLVADGHQVAVVDDLSTGMRSNVCPAATLHATDICGPGLSAAFDQAKPEAVFHLAAQTSVIRSIQDPRGDAEVNILGTLEVVKQCMMRGVRQFVFSSTGGALYGDPAVLPSAETLPPRPVSPYGASKLAAEAYVSAMCPPAGIRYTALRYGNVYGPRQNPSGEAGVIAIFANAMLRGVQPVIYGDGRQERDYVYVGDVVDANVRALESRGDRVVNIGTGAGTSVKQVFRAVAAATGYSGQPAYSEGRPGEVQRIHLDASLASAALGWRARVAFPEGIRRTVASFRA